MAHSSDAGSSSERNRLLRNSQYDPLSYGGIVGFSESRPGASAMNVNSSDESELFLSVSEFDESDYPPFLDLSDGQQEHDSKSPGGDPAPEPVDRPLVPAEQEGGEEDKETVCKCCTSWYDWCLFLSCKLTVSPLRMPLRERKCLRRARTEGWRLLWSLVLPLAVGSVPLQLVWVIAQLVTSLALFGVSVAECVSNGSSILKVAFVSVSGVWMLLTLVDTTVCLVAMWSYRNEFVWKISPYITVLRVIYTAICLYIIVIGFNFSPALVYTDQQSNYPPVCSINWTVKNMQLSQAEFGFSFASLSVFVDLTLLVVAVQFTRKSLKLRNAYSEAYDQPTSKVEGFFLFHAFYELIIHLLFLSSALYFTFTTLHYKSAFISCQAISSNCCSWVSVLIGLYTGLSIAVPVYGLWSISFVHYFWFQKYLISVCLSVQSILQDRETVARLGIPRNVCERIQERFQEIDSELLTNSARNFKEEVTFLRQLVHLCESPLNFLLLPSILSAIFAMLILSDVISLIIAGVVAVGMFVILHIHIVMLWLVLIFFFFALLAAIVVSSAVFLLVFIFCFPVVVLLCLLYCRTLEIERLCFVHVDLVP